MQSTDVGVSHESTTNENEPQAMDRTENINEKSNCEHDTAEETQFLMPKSNVSLLFSVFCTLAWFTEVKCNKVIRCSK